MDISVQEDLKDLKHTQITLKCYSEFYFHNLHFLKRWNSIVHRKCVHLTECALGIDMILHVNDSSTEKENYCLELFKAQLLVDIHKKPKIVSALFHINRLSLSMLSTEFKKDRTYKPLTVKFRHIMKDSKIVFEYQSGLVNVL